MIEVVSVAVEYIFTVKVLLMIIAGLFGGLTAGALPGLTATMAVALLVPFTFTMDPVEGLIILGAIYIWRVSMVEPFQPY